MGILEETAIRTCATCWQESGRGREWRAVQMASTRWLGMVGIISLAAVQGGMPSPLPRKIAPRAASGNGAHAEPGVGANGRRCHNGRLAFALWWHRMRVGIDFGTSYSAAAALVEGQLQVIRFGDATQFRTAVFFPEQIPNPEDFRLTPALAAQVEAMVRASRQQRAQATEAQLRRDAIRVVRRQWMEEQAAATTTVADRFQQAMFGEEAVEAIQRQLGCIPVVYVTGNADQLQGRLTPIVDKPISARRLREACDRVSTR